MVALGLLAYAVVDQVAMKQHEEQEFGSVTGNGHGLGSGWSSMDDLVRLLKEHDVQTLQVWDDGRVQLTQKNGVDQLMGLDRGVLDDLKARGVSLDGVHVKRR